MYAHFVILGSISTSANWGISLRLVGRHCHMWTAQIVVGVPCVLRLCSQHLMFVSIPKHGRLFDKAFKHTHTLIQFRGHSVSSASPFCVSPNVPDSPVCCFLFALCISNEKWIKSGVVMWDKIKTPATPLKTREKQGECTFLFCSYRYAKEQYFESYQGTCSHEQKR